MTRPLYPIATASTREAHAEAAKECLEVWLAGHRDLDYLREAEFLIGRAQELPESARGCQIS